jgi:hypothetical protein
MTRRHRLVLAALAVLLSVESARAQGASVAVGIAMPAADFANGASPGLDAQLQLRTDPMIGPLALRIEISYDHFSGKGGAAGTTFSGQALSLIGDFGRDFYLSAGGGYYQSNHPMTIAGHTAVAQLNYLGAQAAVGANFPVFRWKGFVEVEAVRAFTPGTILIFAPVRFGIRL